MKQTILEIPFLLPEQAFRAFANSPGSVFLDSNHSQHPLSRYSFIAFEPVEIIDSIDDIPAWFSSYEPLSLPPVPFTGGAAGFMSYDGDIRFGLYDQIIAFDMARQKSWYCSFSDTQSDAQLRWNSLARRIEAASPHGDFTAGTFIPLKSRSAYENDIRKVIEYICAGDIFQANLAQRFEASFSGDAYAHYVHLRNINPAPFSAYLNFGDIILSSTSPERFLLTRGRFIEARPIKGTHHDEEVLRTSQKDRAENVMIVDLMRNDLSQVCTDESVDVKSLCQLETYSGLHHLVSVITGELLEGKTCLDALKACSPGGSITGAPKIRAMEIISELEPFKRGPYCGSIGYISFDGTMDMNIAIRTLAYGDGKVIYHAGGGITAGSDPVAEYDETMLKAKKIFESFV